jgi:hypothetical protein
MHRDAVDARDSTSLVDGHFFQLTAAAAFSARAAELWFPNGITSKIPAYRFKSPLAHGHS